MARCFIVARLPLAAPNQFLQMIRWQAALRFPLTAKCLVTFCVFVCVCLEIARDTESPRSRPHYCDIPPTFSSCLSSSVTCSPQPCRCHYTSTWPCDPANACTFDSLLPCPFAGLNVSGNPVRVRKASKFSMAQQDYYFKQNERTFIVYLTLHCDFRKVATLFNTSVSLFSTKKTSPWKQRSKQKQERKFY